MKSLLAWGFLWAAVAAHEEYHPHREAVRAPAPLAEEENMDHWNELGLEELMKAEQNAKKEEVVKNIIIFVGDGMSIPTVTAARIMKTQLCSEDDTCQAATRKISTEGNSGELSWESFPHLGHSKTYSVTRMVPDSAATASAMFSGVKTVGYTLGFDSHIVNNDPASEAVATPVSTVLSWAQDAGMATGVVTTTRITHATPAALYAHTANRNWECDSKMPDDRPETVLDIARQLVERSPGNKTDIVLGGGLANFSPLDYIVPNDPTDAPATSTESTTSAQQPNPKLPRFDYGDYTYNCHRDDQVDLVELWQNKTQGKFISSREELLDDSLMSESQVLGLFAWSHNPYEDQGTEAPTLKQMTETAIKYLKQKSGNKGFFLMVEGGKIDHAHHESMAVRALRETIGLDRAVESAVELTDDDDTLIIVTADHAHTFSIGGYPDRFADITREVYEDEDTPTLADDDAPFTILEYGNGGGFYGNYIEDGKIVRKGVPEKSLDFTYQQSSGIPMFETHGGDDVGIWASGPMSHFFHGTHEQSYIGHVMSYAACIGPHKDDARCEKTWRTENSGTVPQFSLLSLIFLAVCLW